VTLEDDGDQAASSARQRKIIHVGMDAFYASVEQRDLFVPGIGHYRQTRIERSSQASEEIRQRILEVAVFAFAESSRAMWM
jgi:hypothetical protein